MIGILNNGGVKRRRFIFYLASLLPAVALAQTGRKTNPETGRIAATLAAYLDTLLPQDALSPAASKLGIHTRILDEYAASPLQTRLLRAGCSWLDLAAEGSFRDAGQPVRDVIVTWMAQSDWNRVPRRFHEVLRQRAMELYFSHPKSLGGLPISRPPQPLGYPEPWA